MYGRPSGDVGRMLLSSLSLPNSFRLRIDPRYIEHREVNSRKSDLQRESEQVQYC
jgi:hypothetical protein